MKLDIDPEEVLNEPDLHAIEAQIDDYVQELALLGDIDSARELTSAQLTAPPLIVGIATGNSLHFAWNEVGLLPDGIPQTLHENALKEARKHYEENWPTTAEEHRTPSEAGLQACLASAESQAKSSYDKHAQLVKALDISLQLHSSEESDWHRNKRRRGAGEIPSTQIALSDLDLQSADIVKQLVARWTYATLKRSLSSAEKLWPYFAGGLFASAFDITLEEVKAQGRIIVETYGKRLHNHPRPYTSKTIQELLQIANDNTIKNTSLDFWPDRIVPETLLHDPATESEIWALEERLETTLAQDLKSFFLHTNGFGSADQGIFTSVFPDPNIRSTSNLKWVEAETESYALPVELLPLPREIEDLAEAGENMWDLPFPLTDKVLLLGERDVDVIWLIPPETVKETVQVYKEIYAAADDNQKRAVDRAVEVFAGSWEEFESLGWCCLSADLGSPGYTWYTSFRQYLERAAWGGRKRYEA